MYSYCRLLDTFRSTIILVEVIQSASKLYEKVEGWKLEGIEEKTEEERKAKSRLVGFGKESEVDFKHYDNLAEIDNTQTSDKVLKIDD